MEWNKKKKYAKKHNKIQWHLTRFSIDGYKKKKVNRNEAKLCLANNSACNS